MTTARVLKLKVRLQIIRDLGLRMYVSLPPVMSELVANAWDAEATTVHIAIPTSVINNKSEIVVEDNGTGMGFEEIDNSYLQIGRERRKELSTDVTPIKHRKVMGRKGIGKLSVFGVAKDVVVETRQTGHRTIFRMNIDDILNTPDDKDYLPPILEDTKTTKPDGTVIRIKNLVRKRKIDVALIRTRLARRFSILGKDFELFLNGTKIQPGDRALKKDCEYLWTIDPNGKRNKNNISGILQTDNGQLKVSGWIGAMKDVVPEEIGRGVAVFCRGKLVQEPWLFDVTGGKHYAFAYMVGEIHAEFLDEEEDLIATHRSSIVWESEEGVALKEWGQHVITRVSILWGDRKKEEREKKIRKHPRFKKWLQGLKTPAQRRRAEKMIAAIAADDTITDEKRIQIMDWVKESFEYEAFRDLVEEFDRNPHKEMAPLLEIFKEWKIIESIELGRLADGRLTTIKKLKKYVSQGARERPTIHNLLTDYPWLMNPTWTIFNKEVHYSELLKKHFPDKKLLEKDRRIDFLCIGDGQTLHVVELKRPNYAVGLKALEQLVEYVAFVRKELGNSPDQRLAEVDGYLVAGKIQNNRAVSLMIESLKSSRMYVKKYDDMISTAETLFSDFIKAVGKRR